MESLESENSAYEESLTATEKSRADYVKALREAQSRNKELEDNAVENLHRIDSQLLMLADYEASLRKILEAEGEAYEGDLDDGFFKTLEEEKVLLDKWLKYEQIGERYLFAEVSITNSDGRVYIEDTHTGVNLDWRDAVNKEVKKEKMDDLSGFLYNWLDHKDGGYSFVFVTVVVEDRVTRAAVEIIFDTLDGMQSSFDKDTYLINRHIVYQ